MLDGINKLEQMLGELTLENEFFEKSFTKHPQEKGYDIFILYWRINLRCPEKTGRKREHKLQLVATRPGFYFREKK